MTAAGYVLLILAIFMTAFGGFCIGLGVMGRRHHYQALWVPWTFGIAFLVSGITTIIGVCVNRI